MSQGKPEYNEDRIPSFDQREHVRLRPGMYVGGTDVRALYQWLEYLLVDACNEAEAGHCDHISLILREGNELTLANNGRGISVATVKHAGVETPFLEYVMTKSGVRWDRGDYTITGGMMGIGLMNVNALAEKCSVAVKRDGYLWRQEYRAGQPQGEVIQVRPLDPAENTGTTLTLRPDFTIFEPNTIYYEIVAARLRELAGFLPSVTFSVADERTGQAEEFYFPNGLADYLTYLNRDKPVLHPAVKGSSRWTITKDDHPKSTYEITAAVALQCIEGQETRIEGYVNMERIESALHLEIIPAVITSLLRRNWRYYSPNESPSVLSGLTMLVHVRHPYPNFLSAIGKELANTDVTAVVIDAISAALAQWYKQQGTR